MDLLFTRAISIFQFPNETLFHLYICFAYVPAGAALNRKEETRIPGRRFDLCVFRDGDAGPVYPHLAESRRENSYAFFAGRLAGTRPDSGLPQGHAVNSPAADDWQMQPEPDGSWIALKFDGNNDILSAASDPFLLQRWYYAERDNGCYLSNSIIFLKKILGRVSVNRQAISYMLSRGYLPCDNTPVSEIRGLRGGRCLIVADGKIRLNFRRKPAYLYTPNQEMEDAPKRIAEVLQQAVASELQHLDSICVPLSGGMDSRFLLGCALEVLPRESITTISYGYPKSLDFRIAEELSELLGVRSLSLPFDSRAIGELVSENFYISEGMYDCVPNHPLRSFGEAVKTHPFILSGYIGDLVFGSYDLTDTEIARLNDQPEILKHIINRIANRVSNENVISLLNNREIDPLDIASGYLSCESDTADHRYSRWLWEDHLFNRTNFAVQLHRDATFFLSPFVHQSVLAIAYSMPQKFRSDKSGLYEALKIAYPLLYDFPTKSNAGYPLGHRPLLRQPLARAWRKALAGVDSIAGRWLGGVYYHHPRNNYAHPRELMQPRHRKDVLAALKRLQDRTAFDADGIGRLINRYNRHRSIPRALLAGLLTVDEWYKRYES